MLNGGRFHGWAGLLGLIALIVMTLSCDPLFKDEAARLGVTLDGGQASIAAVPCPEDHLVAVSIIDPETVTQDGSQPIGDLWRVVPVASAPGGTLYLIPISDSPPQGFELKIPLPSAFDDDATIQASMEAADGTGEISGSALSFQTDDLRAGEVWVDGRNLVSQEEFVTNALESCE